MDQIVFYHVWREGKSELNYQLWNNPEIRLVIVVDVLPMIQDPLHICWKTVSEFEQQRHNSEHEIYVELPTLWHVPVFGGLLRQEKKHIPRGYGIMLPVFDFGWVYYTQSTNPHPQFLRFLRFSPKDLMLENRMKNETDWNENYVRPSWNGLLSCLSSLNMIQKRVLLGLSRVLGETNLVKELSPQCGWSEAIIAYDQGNSTNPFPEKLWIETWWDMLDKKTDPSLFSYYLAHQQEQNNFSDWCIDMPAYRWIRREMTSEDDLFQKEILFFGRLPETYSHVRMNYLFSKMLTLDHSHSFFTKEIAKHVPPMIQYSKERGDLFHSKDDPDFVPSSAGMVVYPENPEWCIINVRKVNYRILDTGFYITMKGGKINTIYNGISKNEFYLADRETMRPLSPIRPMREEEIPGRQEQEVAIVGVEDVRLVPNGLFYGVTKSFSYSDAIRIISGTYDWKSACFRDTCVIRPPYEENNCEKNWVWCGDNRFIYKWHPVEIGSVIQGRLVIDERLSSPFYFKEFRGSSPAVQWRGFQFFSVHSVCFSQKKNIRTYLHSIVVLDLTSEKHSVIGVTPPFCFEKPQIEYNIGLDIYKGHVLFLYSTRDSTSRYVRVPLWRIVENMYFPDKKKQDVFKTQILQDIF